LQRATTQSRAATLGARRVGGRQSVNMRFDCTVCRADLNRGGRSAAGYPSLGGASKDRMSASRYDRPMADDSPKLSWTAYLSTTIAKPVNALLFFVPPLLSYVVATTYYGLSWEQDWIRLLFMFWAVWHLADALLLVVSPVTFGLRLWFPPLEANPTPEALALVRMVLVMDLLFAGVRGAYAVDPTSPLLFGLVALTGLIQGVAMTLEARAGTSDSRAAWIAWGGAFALGMGLYGAVQEGLVTL
ncbi:MAG: hypothetical protein QF464_17910, partial [Myxococcota bacterium]|nr:hypothetical protein [Myxococcota bacterium]